MDAWNAAMRRLRYCEPRWHLRVKPALEAKQPAAVGIVRPAGARTAPPGSSVAAAVRWRSPLLTILPNPVPASPQRSLPRLLARSSLRTAPWPRGDSGHIHARARNERLGPLTRASIAGVVETATSEP